MSEIRVNLNRPRRARMQPVLTAPRPDSGSAAGRLGIALGFDCHFCAKCDDECRCGKPGHLCWFCEKRRK